MNDRTETLRSPPAVVDTAGVQTFTDLIPTVDPVRLDREMALSLAALPLACLDHPHSIPRERPGYLDERTYQRVRDYESTRAFYGCYDWHSAVNSTWALVRILKEFPDLPVARLIREKLGDHLKAESLEGEVAYFEESRSFERPYGWAWLLALYQEVLLWEDDDALAWATHLQPLAELFAERLVPYIDNLRYPLRIGTHNNTAFAFTMILDYARTIENRSLETAVVDKARGFYSDDVDCPVDYEPSGADFLSPCFEEAKLMANIMEPEEFVRWYDAFFPAHDGTAFSSWAKPVRTETDEEELEEADLLAAESHLIGLALIRAEALVSVARALPTGDPRVEMLEKLAAFHARNGMDAMFDASYLGSHWIGTFALRYLIKNSEQGTRNDE